jgi:hypothetical protein
MKVARLLTFAKEVYCARAGYATVAGDNTLQRQRFLEHHQRQEIALFLSPTTLFT